MIKLEKKISLNESDLYWNKDIIFLKILNYFDGVISTYDKINYKFLKIGNYIFLPHSFCKKDLLIKNKNIYKDKNYKYDFIFTGQLNSYRNELIKQISKYAKIKIIGISSNKKRNKYIKQSKFILGLLKDKYQTTSSTSRTYYAIKNRFLILNQKAINNDHLDNQSLIFLNQNMHKEIKKN